MVCCGMITRLRGQPQPVYLPVKRVQVVSHTVNFVTEVQLTQVFRNNFGYDIEAKYIFPIDPRAAVNGLTIHVGDRVIHGKVQEREEAKATYDAAKAAGHGAYLVQRDEASADVFTTSVGNVVAGSEVVVVISFVQEIHMDGAQLRLTIPAFVAPRYGGNNGAMGRRNAREEARRARRPAPGRGGHGGRCGRGGGRRVADVSRIPLDISATFSLPSKVTKIESPSHPRDVLVQLGLNGKPCEACVTFNQEEQVHLEKDLVLLVSQEAVHEPHVFVEQWHAAAVAPGDEDGDLKQEKKEQKGDDDMGSNGKSPRPAITLESEAEGDVVMAGAGDGAVVQTDATPPGAGAGAGSGSESGALPTPTAASTAVMVGLYPDITEVVALDDVDDSMCEVVFVVDRSGSMRGPRIEAACAALRMCLTSLPEGCLFQIVSFGTNHRKLFPQSRPLTDATLQTARREVNRMAANMGGTEIWTPLNDVFSSPADPARPRQVLLFTDGKVLDTDSVIQLVRRQSQRTGVRCFTFGIGSGVSHALVDGVSEASGGAAEYIQAGDRMETKVMRLLGSALEPALTEVVVDWGALQPFLDGPVAPIHPRPVHAGSRVVLYARLRPGWPAADVTLRGNVPSGPARWSVRVVPPSGSGSGLPSPTCTHVVGSSIHTAMAKARINDLEALGDNPAAKAAAVALGKQFNVASKWTSLVAVEYRELPRPGGEGRHTRPIVVGAVTRHDNEVGGMIRRRRSSAGQGRGRGRGGRLMRKRKKAKGKPASGRREMARAMPMPMPAPAPADRSWSFSAPGFLGGPPPPPGAFATPQAMPGLASAATATAVAQPRSSKRGALLEREERRGGGGGGSRSRDRDRERGRGRDRGRGRRREMELGFAAAKEEALSADGLGLGMPPAPSALVRQSSAERAAQAGNVFALTDDEADDVDMATMDITMDSGRTQTEARGRRQKGGVGLHGEALLTSIVSTQKASGCWTAAAVAKFFNGRAPPVPTAVPGVTAPMTPEVWATALALALLARRLKSHQVEWKLLARKARRWLAKALGKVAAAPHPSAGLAAPDDGNYSIPDPFSFADGSANPHALHKLSPTHDSVQLDTGAEVKHGLPPPTPSSRQSSGKASSSRRLFGGSIRTSGPEFDALPLAGPHSAPKRPARTPGPKPSAKRIPPKLGRIGRAQSERVLSLRQKRALQFRAGLLKDARGIAMGRIERDGTWVGRNNSRQAVFRADGRIESRDGVLLGSIEPVTGSVRNAQRTPIGEILADGSVRDGHANVGHVTADGVAFDLTGNKLGSCDAGPTVSGYIHFFSESTSSAKPTRRRKSSSARGLGRRRSSARVGAANFGHSKRRPSKSRSHRGR